MNVNIDMKQSIWKIHLPLLATQVFFSIIPVSAKLAFKTFTPESIVFFRITGSAFLFVVLFFTCFFEKIEKKTHFLYFACYSIFGIIGNQLFFVKGVSYTSSINGSILISTLPIFTIIFAVLLKKERITFAKIVGMVIAISGVSILVGFDQLDFTGYLKGNIMILLNSMFFAFYLVISKKMLKIYKPFTVMTYMFIFGTIGIIPLTYTKVITIPYGTISFTDYLPLIIIVIFGTFFPYLLNKLILKKTHSSVVAIYTYIQPVLGAVLAMVFLGETLSVKIVLATMLILSGVTFVSFHRYISLPNLFQFKIDIKK